MNDVVLILGTAVAVAASMATAGLFVLRLVISQDVSPLREELVGLRLTLKAAVEQLTALQSDARAGEKELHAIAQDLRAIVADHETRITVLEAHRA